MASPLDLSLPPPPTPSATASSSSSSSWAHHNGPLTPPKKKKRTKVFCFQQLQSAPVKPKKVARKPDPSAPKITMPCSECGRKFWSWKALYGHMRCHPNRQWRGINPPPNLRRPSETFPTTEEDHEAALCLLLLANCHSRGECRARNASVGHKCGICMKVFSTGQALGGHKRCHLEKNNVSSGTEVALSSPGGDVGGGGGCGFDLNLPDDQLEDMGGGGCDDLQLVLRLGL